MKKTYKDMKDFELEITEQTIICAIKDGETVEDEEILNNIYTALEPIYAWNGVFETNYIIREVIISFVVNLYIKLISNELVVGQAIKRQFYVAYYEDERTFLGQMLSEIMNMQVRWTFKDGKIDLVKDIEDKEVE